jgi:translation initiation factor IF-2
VPIIIKADALGAVDAIVHEINKCANERIVPKIVATGVGDVSENDVRLVGGDAKALVIGFNVKASAQAREVAARDRVTIGIFDIIYRLAEWLKEQFERLTPKRETDQQIGLVRIIKTFNRTKEKQVVGGEVLEGIFTRGAKVKLIRRDAEIGRGKVVELQQQKVRAEKVEAGNQFGAQIEARIDIAPGDRLEAFETVIS